MAFVHLVTKGTETHGYSTDINGQARVSLQGVSQMTFSYIGYVKKTISVSQIPQDGVIRLEQKTQNLNEVEILPGENPAHRIIKNCTRNSARNNPEKLDSYRCSIHSKTTFDALAFSEYDQLSKDSVLRGGYMLITESISERKYQSPNKVSEKVLATKFSGLKNPMFAALATDLQPFSFYETYIPVFEETYLNPISQGATKKYLFQLQDTLYEFGDTTFVISYQPRSGKNFTGLQGSLAINSGKWALRNIIATPQDSGFVFFKLQQQYQKVDTSWFPEQLNTYMLWNMETDSTALEVDTKSFIKDIQINPSLNRQDFGLLSTAMADSAAQVSETFWDNQRSITLTPRDSITYHILDSIGDKYHFDRWFNSFQYLSLGRYPIGPVNLMLKHLWRINEFEGNRFGLGLITNDKLVKNVGVGGYFGYGTRDNQWKYGALLEYTLDPSYQTQLKIRLYNDIIERGRLLLNRNPLLFTRNGLREILSAQFNRVEGYEASFSSRISRSFSGSFRFRSAWLSEAYTSEIDAEGTRIPFPTETFRLADISVGLKFSFREKLVQVFNQTVSEGSEYPTVQFQYHLARPELGSSFSYQSYYFAVSDQFKLRNLGTTSLTAELGYTDSRVPPSLLNSGFGSKIGNGAAFLTHGYFQTMQPYEFSGDQYINIFLKHQFGSLLFKANNFAPKISLAHNAGYSALAQIPALGNGTLQATPNWFTEGGVVIDDILRIKYLDMMYITAGAGVFYRYGAYQLPNTTDNFTAVISIGFATR